MDRQVTPYARMLVGYVDRIRDELRRLGAYDTHRPAGPFLRAARAYMDAAVGAEEAAARIAIGLDCDLPPLTTSDTFNAYAGCFAQLATRLNRAENAFGWIVFGVGVEDAAAWANLGFMPEEATGLIADGITPQMYREMEDHAEAQAGGPDALAAERIRRMFDAGELVDPLADEER